MKDEEVKISSGHAQFTGDSSGREYFKQDIINFLGEPREALYAIRDLVCGKFPEIEYDFDIMEGSLIDDFFANRSRERYIEFYAGDLYERIISFYGDFVAEHECFEMSRGIQP